MITHEINIKDYLVVASNSGQTKYSFVKPVDCRTGKLKNTYALAQMEKLF